MKRFPTNQQSLAVVVVFAFSWVNLGCMVTKVKKPDFSKVAYPNQEHIVGVTTKAGKEVAFDPPGGLVNHDEIQAKVANIAYTISFPDVQRLWVETKGISAPRTIGLTAAIVVGSLATLVGIVAATKQSCPFVYSWDGTGYVFDAEPYGGAITRGLERDDFSELEHLRAQNGQYRLLLTNEVDETQYTNLMELWVVDHPRGARVVSDENGVLRAFTRVQSLSAARDRDGNDILPWLTATDRKIWEPDAAASPDGSLTQEVILTFPKPEGASRANLIANAATGLWGSYMIKQMAELHGRDTETWLASLDGNPQATAALHAWGERERVYRLPIEVEEPGGWQLRGTLPSGGPLLAEDRAISLDISHVQGNQVRLRMRPPVGFWAFNSFALASGEGDTVVVQKLAARSAITAAGKNILADLAASDDRYYPMPDNIDRAEVIFPAPSAKPGLDRTIFLHTRGWYQLHLRDRSEPDLSTFNKLLAEPGAAVQFAATRFLEWSKKLP